MIKYIGDYIWGYQGGDIGSFHYSSYEPAASS